MSADVFAFACGHCDHVPFESTDKLTKHISSRHRQAGSFNYNGVSHPLIAADGKYLCPKCGAAMAGVYSLRRHLARLTVIDPCTLDDIGFTYESTCQVAICNHCHFVVDRAMIVDHLRIVHRLDVPNANAVLLVLSMHRLRPHLAIIWDDAIEDQLDESDDEGQGTPGFHPPAFRPGSAPLQGIPVQDGFKCQLCAQRLRQVCVTSKEGMRTHYRRHHKGQAVEYYSVQVQALYGRSRTQAQLCFVQVTPTDAGDMTPLSTFGIPDDIHSVPGHSTAMERKDLNQFGFKFQGYTLLDVDDSFEILKGLCLRLLEASREDTRVGFQPMLGKVMVGESAMLT
ncbi:hypothetical protein V1505DRAFT_402569 [Lipomyces doorenjongii]